MPLLCHNGLRGSTRQDASFKKGLMHTTLEFRLHFPWSGDCITCVLCPREQLAESILHDGSTGCRVVEKFLKILQVVVQEPGQVFKPFLPSIISLCMEQVYPMVAEVAPFIPGGGGGWGAGGRRKT